MNGTPSVYPGVHRDEKTGNYRVWFYAQNEKAYLGTYKDKDLAIKVRKKAEEAYKKVNPNRGLRKDNESGVPGVHRDKRYGKWVARKRNHYIGTYDTVEEARAAILDYEINHGTTRN